MDLKNIEKIESLLSKLVEEVYDLRADNRRLKEENLQMGKELASNEKKYRDKMERLAILERLCSKMETGNASARLKVQSMLTELEKADWS